MSQIRALRHVKAWLRRRLLPASDPELFMRQIAAGAADKRQYSEIDRYRDYRRVFLSPDGLRVLNDILDQCAVFRPIYSRGDVYEMVLREGKRQIGLMILHRMNFEPSMERPDTATTVQEE